jgi:FeS assembly SUF system protein
MAESTGPVDGNTFGTRFTGRTELKEPIVRAMKTVFDPEIPVDIYELGLIYNVNVDEDGQARIEMTLTSPMCPSAEALPAEVQRKVSAIDGIAGATVDIVWDPPWSQDYMSEAARVQLGFF